MKKYNILLIVLVVILFLFPILIDNAYLIHIITMAGIYCILALGLNIIVGWTGLLVLGYAAFYGIGAYTSALFSTRFGFTFWQTLPISMLFTTIFGVLAGAPAIRLKGDYLAIVTLGFGEIVRIVLNNWDKITNGPKGITGIPHPKLFFLTNHRMSSYYLIIIFISFVVVFIKRINNSRIGRALLAIREDEVAASSMGINVINMKLLAFGIGGCFAGLGGAFFAHWSGFVSPESFTFYESVLILCMVVFGGLANITGCIIGAIVLSLMPEVLRDFRTYRMLIFGFLLISLMLFKSSKYYSKISE